VGRAKSTPQLTREAQAAKSRPAPRAKRVKQIPREESVIPPDEVDEVAGVDLAQGVELFCAEYVAAGLTNATRAAKLAFPTLAHGSAKVKASRLLDRDDVQARIAELVEERNARLGLSADRLLEALVEQAFLDPSELVQYDSARGGTVVRPLHEIRPGARQHIRSIKVTEILEGAGHITEIKLADPMPARRLLAEHLKLVGPKDPATINVGVQIVEVSRKLPAEEWEKKYLIAASTSSQVQP
jgi:phage terminase small subunit